jgi:MFS transporter, ACS family, tartrate transporter
VNPDEARRSAIAKAARRLIPFLCLCYAVNFLDRVNVGYAALAMNADLGFTPAIYGTGAGIFFVGYILFEIPSNLALQRFGARIWIARIMISWGLIATAMALVSGETSFYVMRFLLGVAEAGFFPGIILYLTYWFPARERARIVALFMAATPLATMVGGPVSGALLEFNGLFGLKGWQWLFIVEGLPAIVLGVIALRSSTTGRRRRTGSARESGRRCRRCWRRRPRQRGRQAMPSSARRSRGLACLRLASSISAS